MELSLLVNMDLTYRPRRLRRTNSLRDMVRENSVSASDFIYPLFVHEGSDIQGDLFFTLKLKFPKNWSEEELRFLEKLRSVRIDEPRSSWFDQART